MPKKKTKKKNGNGSVGGKADVHAHEEGKRNKSLLGHNARNGIDEKNSYI
jgi:hypothetical protein